MVESKTSLPGDAVVDPHGADAADDGGAGDAGSASDVGGGVGLGAGFGEKDISQRPPLFSAVSLFSEIYISKPFSTKILVPSSSGDMKMKSVLDEAPRLSIRVFFGILLSDIIGELGEQQLYLIPAKRRRTHYMLSPLAPPSPQHHGAQNKNIL